MDNPPLRSVNATVRDAMARRLHRRSVVTGQVTLPAVPGMLDQYVSMCETLFMGVGRPFTAEQLDPVRAGVAGPVAPMRPHPVGPSSFRSTLRSARSSTITSRPNGG